MASQVSQRLRGQRATQMTKPLDIDHGLRAIGVSNNNIQRRPAVVRRAARKIQVRAAAPRRQGARREGGVMKTLRRQAEALVFTEPTTCVPLLPVTGGHPYFLK